VTKKRAAALFRDAESLLQIPFELKYLSPAWATFYLLTGLGFLQETGIRSIKVLLYEQRGVPLWVLPTLYIAFAALLIIRYFRGWRLSYVGTLFVWSIPMWVHLAAAYDVGIPWPSRISRWFLIIVFVWAAHDVEHNHSE